ncbi:3-hydroxyacyl-CoA dehydrogenase family protein [Chloroflexota bacterium]
MEIKKVGILGMGVQGQGISEVAARAGCEVVVATRHQESLKRGLDLVKDSMARGVKRGRLTQKEMDAAWGRIKGTLTPEDFHDCDMLIEAVPEIIEQKKEVFRQYDGILKPEAIMATDTSTLSIVDLAKCTNREDKVCGTHFFWPVPVMELVEVVVSIVTSKETAQTVLAFCRSLGKKPSRVKDSPGFITNYLFVAWSLQALRLYERGIATMEDIDNALEKGLNHPMGVFKLHDMAGVDTLYHCQQALWEMTKDPVYAPVLLLDKMYAAGHLGRKTGKGFYEYKEYRPPSED